MKAKRADGIARKSNGVGEIRRGGATLRKDSTPPPPEDGASLKAMADALEAILRFEQSSRQI